MNSPSPQLNSTLAALRQFTQRRPPSPHQCELCAAPLAEEHEHLLEPPTRKLLCCCQACGMLFGAAGRIVEGEPARFKRVPKRLIKLTEFQLDDATWETLGVPINLAFFYESSVEDRVVAMYPSPGGATESQLHLPAWQEIAAANPILESLEHDTEALLINRMGEARQHFVAPIDVCYQLVGLIRIHWQGLSGGKETWEQMAEFFAELQQKAQPQDNATHA